MCVQSVCSGAPGAREARGAAKLSSEGLVLSADCQKIKSEDADGRRNRGEEAK